VKGKGVRNPFRGAGLWFIWFVWFLWFISFIWHTARNKQDKPKKPKKQGSTTHRRVAGLVHLVS
jgi:hypothetical protein